MKNRSEGAGKLLTFTAKGKSEAEMLKFKKTLESLTRVKNKEILHVGKELLFSCEPKYGYKLKVCNRILNDARSNNIHLPWWMGKYGRQGEINKKRNPLRRHQQYEAKKAKQVEKVCKPKRKYTKHVRPGFFKRVALAVKLVFGGK